MTHRQDGNEEQARVSIAARECPRAGLPPKLDPDEYMDCLEGFNLSTAQKHDVLHALWHIMGTVVDIGFGLDTVHIVLPETFEKASPESTKLLDRDRANKPISKAPPTKKGTRND